MLSHNEILDKGTAEWNIWRNSNPGIKPDLTGASLEERKLTKINLSGADLTSVDFTKSDLDASDLSGADLLQTGFWDVRLRKANLSRSTFHLTFLDSADLSEANISYTNFKDAVLNNTSLKHSNISHSDLCGINLSGYDLRWVDFSHSDLSGANLNGADLSFAKLDYANLSSASLKKARLVETSLRGANLSECNIYGISAWDIDTDEATRQNNLIISKSGDSKFVVDSIEIAQFIYLIMNNKKIRDVFNILSSKAVLILGRFKPDRKIILDTIKNELPKYGYLPIMFDFTGPADRSTHETVLTIAGLCRFVIADITDPVCIPEEVTEIVKSLPSVPVRPIIEIGKDAWGMSDYVQKYKSFIDLYHYTDKEEIIRFFNDIVIMPAEKRYIEINAK